MFLQCIDYLVCWLLKKRISLACSFGCFIVVTIMKWYAVVTEIHLTLFVFFVLDFPKNSYHDPNVDSKGS